MLSVLCTQLDDLITRADLEAASLGHAWVGTGHLLLALLQSESGFPAELLSREGLSPEEVRATAFADTDPQGEGDEPRERQRSRQLVEIQHVAHELAVLLESEGIHAEHALLAIVLSDGGRAAKVLDDHAEGTWQRIEEGVLDSLAAKAVISPVSPSATAREALALAWSRALAVGREEIEVDDLLRGICAPGWTIGARALAALGTAPSWAPALWTGEQEEDPYRRIPFAATARSALQAASEEAAQLGREYVGTEHLLLGISAVASEPFEQLIGVEVDGERLRSAIADAVSSSEQAQNAEARRRGWDPEGDREPNFAERIAADARGVAEKTGEQGADKEQPPGCWHGFLAAILANQDEDLAELLDDLMLEPREIHGLAKDEEDRPLAEAIALAERRQRGAELEPIDVILATVAIGSPRLLAALDDRGLTAAEVEAQLAEWRLRQQGDTSGAPSVLAASVLNLLAGALTSAALVLVVLHQEAWWKLVFLPLIWSGYPGFGPLGSSIVVVVLTFAVSPLVGALQLLGIPVDILHARAERQAIWARTGVRLSLRELRCVTRRTLGFAGLFNQFLRQLLRSMLPAWPRPPRRRMRP